MAQKVWMITGASRGFGAEISKAVLTAGDKLVATARKVDTLEGLGKNADVLLLALDVTVESQVKTAVDAAIEHFGRIDVLVNNAGYGLLGSVEESSAEEVEAIYRTNVFGLLNVTRAVLPYMRKQKSGHIINNSLMPTRLRSDCHWERIRSGGSPRRTPSSKKRPSSGARWLPPQISREHSVFYSSQAQDSRASLRNTGIAPAKPHPSGG